MSIKSTLGKIGMTLRGEYDPERDYVRLDVVSFEGESYAALKSTRGTPPTEAQTWQKIAEKGDPGETGQKGDPGAPFMVSGGAYPTVEALEAAVPEPAEGVMYNIGDAPPYRIHRWTGSAWEDQGELQGPPGENGKNGQDGKDGAPGEPGADGQDGKDGATFTPSVDEAGNLTWTNDKGLDNPPQANIRGPQGEPGKPGSVPFSDEAPKPLGDAAAGVSEQAARADHVHKRPTAEEIGARPNTWTPSAADVGAVSKDATIAVDHGGTGATTAAGARNALGLGNTNGPVPVLNGGTGANNAATARTNLGIKRVTYNNVSVVGGESNHLIINPSTYSLNATTQTIIVAVVGKDSEGTGNLYANANISMTSSTVWEVYPNAYFNVGVVCTVYVTAIG